MRFGFLASLLSLGSVSAEANLYEGRLFVTNMFNDLLNHETADQKAALNACLNPQIDHNVCHRIQDI